MRRLLRSGMFCRFHKFLERCLNARQDACLIGRAYSLGWNECRRPLATLTTNIRNLDLSILANSDEKTDVLHHLSWQSIGCVCEAQFCTDRWVVVIASTMDFRHVTSSLSLRLFRF